MKTLTPGHKYILNNFENKENGQTIQFIEKIKGESDSLTTVNDGTTNEEVLQMLIDRMEFLYNKFPSNETALAISNCKTALYYLEKRTKDRVNRGVEGKHKA